MWASEAGSLWFILQDRLKPSQVSRESSSGQTGSLSMVCGAPALGNSPGLAPKPRKEAKLLVVARRWVSGDPNIKYTSLSCGPRNPCLKANQFPALVEWLPLILETQINIISQTLDIDASSWGKREDWSDAKAEGSAGGLSWIKLGK